MALDSGEHRFVIRYTVDWALISGAGRDTLYWNAVGSERTVPIAEAILAVHLPAAVPSENIEVEPRVGGLGVSFPRRPENTLERVDDASGAIVYRATNMNPRQSLSLAVTWPSGYIHMPKFVFLRREGGVLVAPALLFLYYLIAWVWIGPDPKPGVVVARYEPPEGISPAAARYIASGTTDGRSFAAVIAQLAVHGCIRVESENGKYKLSRLMSDRAAEAALAPEEKFVLALLFEDGPEIVLSGAMDERNAAQNGRYVSHIHDELADQLGKKYFTRHSGIIALGVLATFVFALALAVTARGRDTSAAVFTTLWVLFMGLMMGHDDRVFVRLGLENRCARGNGLDQIASGHGCVFYIRRGDCVPVEKSGFGRLPFFFPDACRVSADQSRVGAAPEAQIAARPASVGSNRRIPPVPGKGGSGQAGSPEPGRQRARRSRPVSSLRNRPRSEGSVGRSFVANLPGLHGYRRKLIPVQPVISFLARTMECSSSSTGFSLWVLVLASTNPHRLKPVLQKATPPSLEKCGL